MALEVHLDDAHMRAALIETREKYEAKGARLPRGEPPTLAIDCAVLHHLKKARASMDREVIRVATQLGKQVFSLESAEEHVSGFFSSAQEKYAGLNVTDAFMEGIDCVRYSHLEAMTAILSDATHVNHTSREERNKRMAKRILDCMKQFKKTLCAVGAAHCVGKAGILEHLLTLNPTVEIRRVL